ncbi:hypothetical protein EJ04DRAFT_507655 [Polyplosphaeria fusca]|uniref:GPI anchored protein n=1 Tax=Polyplosphaeria fusca TaxID=682080 RepID=A0A9P4RC83_9PLEO|nr:hypothetical protein EJ04DRAFT_507655 [Polyplosphaeria fusca]
MYLQNLLALPPTILLLLSAVPAASKPSWPHNLPRHVKYFPEDEVHVKRSLEILDKLKREKPIGVKKMSTDEGEMFFLDNWIFASDVKKRDTDMGMHGEKPSNVTLQAMSPLRPIFEESFFGRLLPRAALSGRDFKCPEGTNNCSSINAPDNCCGAGYTCINIEDTGDGSVGCCPEGEYCAGTISCDTENGYTECPDSTNKGCCLPGFTCQGVGCVAAGTSTTIVLPSTSAAASSSSTAVIVVPTSRPSSSAPPPPPSSSSSTSSTCTSDYFPCPSRLGGGCCPNGQVCGTGTSCLDASTTYTPSAPIRPTGSSGYQSSSTPPETTSDLFPTDICPTGFYVCSAYYPSGCCRVGRDCKTTGTCDPTASVSVVVSNGVTIAAPSGASFQTTAAGQPGTCQTGWYSCPASVGGNCCLNGYSCGEQCTATTDGRTIVTGKIAPSTASIISNSYIWILLTGIGAIGAAMILL